MNQSINQRINEDRNHANIKHQPAPNYIFSFVLKLVKCMYALHRVQRDSTPTLTYL